MSSSYGENIKLTIFGQSHSESIGMTLDGVDPGEMVDMEELNRFLKRRAPGRNDYSTPRKEEDSPRFVSGLVNDVTCGAPICALIDNTNTRSADYSQLKIIPRPGHADYTAEVKYKGFQDYAGGGHFSGRLTAPLCIAGGIVLQILNRRGITIRARIKSIGNIVDDSAFDFTVSNKSFPVVNDDASKEMQSYILNKKAEGDSVGGVIECIVSGLPAGVGDPMFLGLENRIASIVFGIPAVKGIEFGAGFDSTRMCGSENNDEFHIENGRIVTDTNNCGGILGGISNGMDIVFRVAVKPTPSIAKSQKSIKLDSLTETELKITGRHDPCIVPRAVPCVEAAAALAIYDAILSM